MTRTIAKVRTRMWDCRVCHTPIKVGANTVNQPRCSLCGIKAGVQAAIEMHEKSGPTYEKWRGGMLAFAERLGRTTPPPS